MLPEELQRNFPKLSIENSKKTSEATKQYNCIAWSAKRDKNHWWQPSIEEPWDYWPPGISDDGSLESFISLFEHLGYEQCENADLELFFEKVAIYADDVSFTHVSSQLLCGAWTSKLGPAEDIQHDTLGLLEGVTGWEYGSVRKLLKRRHGLSYAVKRVIRLFLKRIGF